MVVISHIVLHQVNLESSLYSLRRSQWSAMPTRCPSAFTEKRIRYVYISLVEKNPRYAWQISIEELQKCFNNSYNANWRSLIWNGLISFFSEPDDTYMSWAIKPNFYLEMVVSCDHHKTSVKDSGSLRYVIVYIVVVLFGHFVPVILTTAWNMSNTRDSSRRCSCIRLNECLETLGTTPTTSRSSPSMWPTRERQRNLSLTFNSHPWVWGNASCHAFGELTYGVLICDIIKCYFREDNIASSSYSKLAAWRRGYSYCFFLSVTKWWTISREIIPAPRWLRLL